MVAITKPETREYKAKDYKSGTKPIWCPGCGNYAFLSSFYRALATMKLPPENVAIASGIGCSGRFPAFAKGYGFHGVHGRALPLATGIKMGNPDLTVFAIGGDGDAFSIGAGHIPHAASRNADITYVVLDNEIYGLTKGQPSPTTPHGRITKASPYGKVGRQTNPVMMMLAYKTSFVARGNSTNPRQLTELLIKAVEHPGFSFIHVCSPCVTYSDTYAMLRERSAPVPESHNVQDRNDAIRLAADPGALYMGVFYRDDDEEGFVEELETLGASVRRGQKDGYSVADVVNQYRIEA